MKDRDIVILVLCVLGGYLVLQALNHGFSFKLDLIEGLCEPLYSSYKDALKAAKNTNGFGYSRNEFRREIARCKDNHRADDINKCVNVDTLLTVPTADGKQPFACKYTPSPPPNNEKDNKGRNCSALSYINNGNAEFTVGKHALIFKHRGAYVTTPEELCGKNTGLRPPKERGSCKETCNKALANKQLCTSKYKGCKADASIPKGVAPNEWPMICGLPGESHMIKCKNNAKGGKVTCDPTNNTWMWENKQNPCTS